MRIGNSNGLFPASGRALFSPRRREPPAASEQEASRWPALSAVGRLRPRALYALGVEVPVWLAERTHWRRVLPLLRHYDARRACCASWLLRLPDVGTAVLAALARLEVTVSALTTVVW